ncbi:Uncharacterised protein [Paenibacillus thiaminolyticus]|nr:Uncharacterised protein [Paenibacillus thiaminolyticus]
MTEYEAAVLRLFLLEQPDRSQLPRRHCPGSVCSAPMRCSGSQASRGSDRYRQAVRCVRPNTRLLIIKLDPASSGLLPSPSSSLRGQRVGIFSCPNGLFRDIDEPFAEHIAHIMNRNKGVFIDRFYDLFKRAHFLLADDNIQNLLRHFRIMPMTV